MFWEEKIETLPLDRLISLQEERLRNTILRACESPFYRDRLAKSDVSITRNISMENLCRLPFTTKDDLRQNWPYGFLATTKDSIVRMHSSSGTTGRATVVFHTLNDIKNWTSLLARSLYGAGLRRSDVFQNMMTYGLFTGGLGFHYGAEEVGALVIPSGAGNSKRQIQLMRDFSTTAIHIIPSYAMHLATVFDELGIDPKRELDLRFAFVGAEPHSEELRLKIEDFYGCQAFNSYGLSEMNGPGVAFECPFQNGMHIWEDHFIAEIVDPQTLDPLPDGEYGELVMTTLMREGMPIIRYRTRDLTRVIPGICPCGRSHRRIERIKGRSDDMIIIKGVNIFPVQIEKCLMGIRGVGRNFLITLITKGYIDEMVVKVEYENGYDASLDTLKKAILEELRSELLITPKIELVPIGTLPTYEGKAVRVNDERNK
ncbi:MAG: phenylacetate--CoA ligase [Deltaproteobacteria bacterium]|nr:phenylacetate--CoA ligase [Deltaproteobacteria bacterium]